MGALVASKQGANPSITDEELDQFISYYVEIRILIFVKKTCTTFFLQTTKPISVDKSLEQFLTKDGALYLVLNRPEVRNAFNGQLIEQLLLALDDAADNEAVRSIVLTGSGSNFCAGGDINYMRSLGTNSFEENKEDALQMAYLMQALHEFPKPTIARVNGAAYGGGVGLLCCCDMAFGTSNTKICLSEVKIGMVPATIGPYILKAIGVRNAHRLMLTAEVMQGKAAVKHQLLTQIIEEENWMILFTNSPKK